MKGVNRFLDEGDRVKVTMRFRGREMAHQDIGMQLLVKVQSELEAKAKVESAPRSEGRQLVMVLAPRSAGGHRKKRAARPRAALCFWIRPAAAVAPHLGHIALHRIRHRGDGRIAVAADQLLVRLFEPASPANPICDLTPRDWADLPTYHPRRESESC